MKKALAVLLSLMLTIGLLAACGTAPGAGADRKEKIALITTDRAEPRWAALETGAMRAAEELGVEVVIMSPEEKDDAQQSQQISNAVADGCEAIVIAAGSSDAVTSALNEAIAAGVKIICVDTPADVEAEAVFFTDNKAAGVTAGEAMIAALEERGITDGTIGIINVDAADAAALQREAGFRQAFEGKAYTLLETEFGEGNADTSQTIAEDYIAQGVAGIFGCDESAVRGSGKAVRTDIANVAVVGFGESDDIQELMDAGYIQATMIGNPDAMGYEGVKAAAAALKGEELGGAVTDVGVTVLKTEVRAVKASGDYRIALITMDRIDQHWITLEEGAMKAAAELGCEVVNMSPSMKNDIQQSQQISKAVTEHCDAIVIAANESDSVSNALKEAVTAGVRIICVDTPLNADAEATFITDNTSAGFAAGETMIAELEARGIHEGTIGIIGINAAAEFAVQRETGFREAFEGKGYTLLETEFGEGDAAKSHAVAENEIAQGVVGIFGSNEGATVGIGNAVKAAKADVVCVGFDKSDIILDLIADGHIHATVAQNPQVMGYQGIKAACASLNGVNLGGAVTDTGVTVLTKE